MTGPCPHGLRLVLAAVATVAAAAVRAQAPMPVPEAPALAPVVVTGSIRETLRSQAPHAITVIDANELRTAGPMVNLSEALARVPGLTVNNRNNYAQDLQMSSRGFGARAPFGVRGLRLYTDGIPATMPDGQGQVSHFDLQGAARVEVLRGPFSALYGNSSGGVISLVSAPARTREAEAAVDAGSFGLRQLRAAVGGPVGPGLDLKLTASHLRVQGFRPHSAAERSLGGLRLGWQDEDNRLVALLSTFGTPAQDPLGLTRAQWEQNARQTAPQAQLFNTRKTARQSQAGIRWEHFFDQGGALREVALTAYGGRRSVAQWLAIPPAAQAAAGSGGGVVDFDRGYGGLDARLGWQWGSTELVAGLSHEAQHDDRRGFENFIGSGSGQQLGLTGAPRRLERNTGSTREAYVQLETLLPLDLTATAGVRGGIVRLGTRDAFLANGDDSGSLRYSFANPVLGLRWKAADGLIVYGAAARGFESPTLGELAYRPDGQAGFNTALRPQTSRQYEIGAKLTRGETLSLDVAVFRVESDNEIGVQANTGGRASYQNVGRTLRQGVESWLAWKPRADLRAQLSLAVLDARYRDGFLTCTGSPCAAPTVPVARGNRIAGTHPWSMFAEVAWKPWQGEPTELGLELKAQGRTAVNDTNSDFAPGHATANLRLSHSWPLGRGEQLQLLLRLDNVTDRRYVGSVIVNEGNGRFFEPAPPRSLLLSLRWLHR